MALSRRVAIKLYDITTSGQMPVDEARLQATCQHPNLMPLYDVGSDPLLGVAFLVMPLYPGADLQDMLDRYGQMPYRMAILCADQICSALDFLWQRGQFVHGDVKPANIWLTASGAALLMDFNVYGLLIHSRCTRVGTPGYTAPEALEGHTDSRSDLFSLGCVLYQCLAGVPPFQDDEAVLAGRYIPLRRLRPGVRRSLEMVVHTAIDKDPCKRFQSAREFQTALRQPTTGPGAPRPAWRSVRTGIRMAILLARWGWRIGRFAIRHPVEFVIMAFSGMLAAHFMVIRVSAWVAEHAAMLRMGAYFLLGAMVLVPVARWWLRRRFK